MPGRRDARGAGLGSGRQLIASVAVSGFGTWSYNVALAVYAFERTHSAAWVAAVTVGRYIPALVLSSLAGTLVDRLPRRGLAVAGDVLCAAVMTVLALLSVADAPLWTLILVAAVSSTVSRVQVSALLSLAADVVVESQVTRASTLAGAAEAVATAMGSAVASALLVHVDAWVLFVINAASFAVSAVLVMSVDAIPARPRRPAAPERAGARPTAVFRPLQLSRGLVACVYGADVVILTVVAGRTFGAGASGYGWLLAAAGAGGLAAAAVVRRARGTGVALPATVGLVLYALAAVAFLVHLPPGAAVAVQVVRGFGCVVATSAVIAGLQRSVPSSLSGRVFGTTQSLVLAGTCVGAVLAPVLLDAAGFAGAVIVVAVAPVLAQLALLPAVRSLDRRGAALLAALDPRLDTLRRLDLLRDANRSTLYAVADGAVDVDVDAGTAVVRQGEESDALYVLVTGEVEVTAVPASSPATSSQPVVLRTVSALDHFGEIGLLHGTARTATVTTTTPCRLWRVPAEVFLAAIAQAAVSGALSDTVRIRIDTTPIDVVSRSGPVPAHGG